MSLYQTGGDLKTSAPNFKVYCSKYKQLKWRQGLTPFLYPTSNSANQDAQGAKRTHKIRYVEVPTGFPTPLCEL